MRRLLKYSLFAFLGLLGVIAGLLLMTQTRPFKNWLRDKIVAVSNANLNGRLQIGRLDGNLIGRIEAHDLLLESAGDTMLYLPKLTIDLAPTRFFRKEIAANAVVLDSLYIKLLQLPDSSWNFSHLVTATEPAKPDTAPRAFALGWKISVADFHLNSARAALSPLDTLSIIPKRFDNINSHLALTYTDNSQRVELKEFRLQTHRPVLFIDQLSFLLNRTGEQMLLQDFILHTSGNRIVGQGALDLSNQPAAEASIESEPLDFAELRLFIPELPLYSHPEFAVDAIVRDDSLYFDITLTQKEEHLRLYGHVAAMQAQPRFLLEGDLKNLDIGRWLNDAELASNINGNFQLAGNGKTLETIQARLSGDLHDCYFARQHVEHMRLQADLVAGDLNGDLEASGKFGHVAMDARIDDIANSQTFAIRGELAHFDAAQFSLQDSIETDLNLTFAAQGHNLRPELMQAKVRIDASPSVVSGTRIDTLFCELNVRHRAYEIDTLYAGSQPLQVHLAGELRLDADSDLRYGGRAANLMALKTILRADTVAANGTFSGKLSGKMDSLLVEASYGFEKVLYNSFAIDTVAGDLRVVIEPDSLQGHFTARAENAGLKDFQLHTIDLRTEFTENSYHLFLDTAKDSLSGHTEVLIEPDSLLRLTVLAMVLNLGEKRWSGGDESMQLLFGEDTYEIRNFRLTSNEKLVHADGTISTRGTENFNLRIEGIDLGALTAAMDTSATVNGNVNLNLKLEGSADDPIIVGEVNMFSGQLADLAFENLQGKFDYANERLSWDLTLNLDATNKLTSDGYLPLSLSLATGSGRLYRNRPTHIRLATNEFSLAFLQPSLADEVETIRGKIHSEVKLENTVAEPQLKGFFRLENGALKIPAYGVNYENLQAELRLDSTRVSIVHFQARHNKGMLSASGYASFDSSIVQGNIQNGHINISTNDFLLASTKNYEISVKGDVELTGTGKQTQFSGAVTVLRSSFFLPALVGPSDATDIEEALPLLVAATASEDSTKVTSAARFNSQAVASEYYTNLRGTLKVEIPRNTWLRSPNMNVEISGSLDVVKNGPAFEIFGYIRTQRGNYDFYGKRFDIVSGTFTFQGGAEYNPKLQIEARHTLRTADKQKKTLTLQISGDALEPKLNFTIDNDAITEGDAISYLFFGRSLDELTHGKKAGATGETDEAQVAQDLAAALLSAEISKALGKTFNLDVLEVKAQQSWQQASFVVGKYITNDLFVSYQKEFGDPKSNEVAPELITLEYEVTPFLFLQLINGDDKQTGYDIIFKFER